MKLFSCPSCSQVVFFENVVCERCNHALGFEPEAMTMLALDAADGLWREAGTHGDPARSWKYCANYAHGVCNWLIEGSGEDRLCRACRHNVVIPDLSDPQNVRLWGKLEQGKRRLFYTIFRLGLPLLTRAEHPEGLGFEFLTADLQTGEKVMTGHNDGLVTIALAEADDPERERRRTAMGEPYRTLLGHFRHEVGHWYWDRLVRDGGMLEECRAVFGDDSQDYNEALRRHYAGGPRPLWQNDFVSAYSGAHAWEDFAETWAHYFHIVDTLESGGAWGIELAPRIDEAGLLSAHLDFGVFDRTTTMETIAAAWLPLALALNSFNRSMGLQDLYPFVLSPTVIGKLGFIHDLVHGRVGRGAEAAETVAAAAAA